MDEVALLSLGEKSAGCISLTVTVNAKQKEFTFSEATGL
jgi:hypothetical protein